MKKTKEKKIEFKNQNEEDRIRQELRSLLEQPGWKYLVTKLDDKIKHLTDVIVGDVEGPDGTKLIKTFNDLELYRVKRDITLNFRNLPDIIIGMIELSQPIDIDSLLDPYEKEKPLTDE